ncbi:single-stranded DNA-binding protein [Paraburkholderia sp. UCT31]|uniref:single-stranded DNA-binding protein n=1 Tax=Paraburkholderia sp. UCT31 TaxID=2615209 RepID=UPI001655DDF7|nr:single-stranded DNA-binding protein [Paraburkholderia sp. UCT31]
MIDGLVSGTLAKDPEARTAKNGNAYALATLRVPTGGDSVIFARVMAFDAHVRDELLALSKGDSVSVTGPLELGIWNADNGEARVSMSMVTHGLVSAYHVRHKRAEVANAQQQHAARAEAKHANGARASPQRSGRDFHDDELGDVAF